MSAMTETSSAERQKVFSKLYREELRKLTPNVPGNRYSGQQVSYAKGRAGRRMLALGY